MYKEIKPSSEFEYLIDTFWTYSNKQQKERFKILPDNCIDIIFDLSDAKTFVSGILSNYREQELKANSNLIGVRFKSECFSQLTYVPLIYTKNTRIELSEITPYYSDISEELNYHNSTLAKLQLIQKSILLSKNKLNKPKDELIISIAQKIRFLKGNISSKELATSNFISLRQLERRFKNTIGLTIKEFSSIVRFKNSKQIIRKFSKSSFLDVAFEAGFYDHAHMSNEFKRISGENPSYFR